MAELVPDLPKTEAAIVEMTNAFRRENKLGEVARNAKLTDAARIYAEFLAKSDLFSHTADGRQPADRIKSAGYGYCQISENLALNLDSRGFETRQLARDAVEGWKKSPGHRKNLVAPHVVEIGVAVARAKGEHKYLSVQLFGRPESLKYEFTVTNKSPLTLGYRFGADGQPQALEPSSGVRHTTCTPGELRFESVRLRGTTRAINGTFEARDGDVYTLKGDTPGEFTIDVKRKVVSGDPAKEVIGKR